MTSLRHTHVNPVGAVRAETRGGASASREPEWETRVERTELGPLVMCSQISAHRG